MLSQPRLYKLIHYWHLRRCSVNPPTRSKKPPSGKEVREYNQKPLSEVHTRCHKIWHIVYHIHRILVGTRFVKYDEKYQNI